MLPYDCLSSVRPNQYRPHLCLFVQIWSLLAKKKDNESHTLVFRAIVHKPMGDIRVGLHLELK